MTTNHTRPCASTVGRTGRADLLKMLVASGNHGLTSLTLEHTSDNWFGYIDTSKDNAKGSDDNQKFNLHFDPPLQPPNVGKTLQRTSLKLNFIHTIVERATRTPADTEKRNTSNDIQPLETEADDDRGKTPKEIAIEAKYADLVPFARILPAIRRLIGSTRFGKLDVDKLIDCLAIRQLPTRLPRQTHLRWPAQFVVVLDFSDRLWPYRNDMHRLARMLLQQCGHSGVSIRIFNDGPDGYWRDWIACQTRRPDRKLLNRSWSMPAPDTPILLVSDFGLLLGTESDTARAWQAFINRLRMAQLRSAALTPLGAEQVDRSVLQHLPVLRWSPDAPTHPVQVHGNGSICPAGLADLLVMVAATRRVDPPLLRALRRINPVAPTNAGLEGALWCHPAVEAGFAATVRIDAAADLLQLFSRMLPDLQFKLKDLRHTHHAHLCHAVEHEEMLLWATHVSDATALVASKEIQAAVHFTERLTALLQLPGSDPGVWLQVANGIVHRAGSLMSKAFDDELRKPIGSVLNDLLNGVIQAQGGKGSAPDWADPGQLPAGPETFGWLVRDAASGYLLLQGQAPGQGQTGLGEPLRLDQGVRIRRGNRYELCQANALPIYLAELDQRTELELLTAHESLTLATVQRPLGTSGWSVSRNGLSVAVPAIAGTGYEITESGLRFTRSNSSRVQADWLLVSDASDIPLGKNRITYGIDAPYGIYVDLHIKTTYGQATQRLRWIEPGIFRMGSPDNEGPQHPVTLTRGFWLADTACTQALWQTVMGKNPSYFKDDPQCPVERVSWNDVQPFLRALEALLPGVEASLPSEAQWEYACRAGTETVYHFGNDITPKHANYGNNTEKTVQVKSLPANNWGLYEMHGNVWEWCDDGMRTYDAAPQQDPEGPVEEQRAMRGGSWFDGARRARSACRNAYVTSFAIVYLGFRLCLKPTDSGRPKGWCGHGGPESDMSTTQRAKK